MGKNLVEILKEAGIVHRGRFVLRRGEISSYYLDVKRAYGDPELLGRLADEMWKLIEGDANCIASKGYGGIPLASSISTLYQIPLTIIRDSPKKHGKISSFEGYVPKEGDSIAIVDDVFTSGSSALEAIKNLSLTNANIVSCCVVFKREESNLNIPLKYLFTPYDIGL
jgi:orotate phosphoribosyltransferase